MQGQGSAGKKHNIEWKQGKKGHELSDCRGMNRLYDKA